MKTEKVTNENIMVILSAFFVSVLFLLPIISNFMYSIDDYHLLQVYNINIANMGYNYYSTGRFVEGILAEIFSIFNLLPINKPVGQLLFSFSLCFLGTVMIKELKINGRVKKIIFVLIFALNPFWGELYYYSTVTVFCGIAVLFLAFGFVFSERYEESHKIRYLLLSMIFYYCSLATYQIFYLIILYLIVYWFLEVIFDSESTIKNVWKKRKVYIYTYVGSFILFYIIMKIAFSVKEPTLNYNMDNIGDFIKGLFQKSYWNELFYNLKYYLLSDNEMNSKLLFLIMIIVPFLYISIQIWKYEIGCKKNYILFVAKELLLALIICIGIILSVGFSLLRISEISYRSFTTIGIFEALLILLAQKKNEKSKVIAFVALACVLINGTRMGRVALNTYRLNSVEENLANRIVYRLEEMENFNPNATLVLFDSPVISNINMADLGDYNSSALSNFSKVLMVNEISGYNFKLPTSEEYELATTYYNNMSCWPNKSSVVSVNDIYIVRMN